MKTLRETIDQLDEISRRGFLQGAGAAAVAGAAGGTATKANAQQVSQWVKYATDLATSTFRQFARGQDTGYDLRNWLVSNVSHWVMTYCVDTNSYNAKEVIDYCNRQALDATGLEKQNRVVTGFFTNMKDRYQDFLTAYQASIIESKQKFNNLQNQTRNTQPVSLTKDEEEIIAYAVNSYYFAKEDGNEAVKSAMAQVINKVILAFNMKSSINEWYKSIETNVGNARKSNDPKLEGAKKYFLQNYQQIINNVEKVIADKTAKKPEFESVKQGVAEESSPDALAKIDELSK